MNRLARGTHGAEDIGHALNILYETDIWDDKEFDIDPRGIRGSWYDSLLDSRDILGDNRA